MTDTVGHNDTGLDTPTQAKICSVFGNFSAVELA